VDDANVTFASLPNGLSDDEDAPEWMHMAKSIERDGGFKPPAPRRVALPPPVADVGADDVPALDETYAENVVMHFDAPVRTKRDDETAEKETRASTREFDADAHDAALEEMREQMRKMAESQSQVLIRIGDFVSESSKAIAGLTARVESMENTVGAAVSSAATVASAAQRMAERDNAEALRLSSRAAKLSAARATEEVKLALARDRAALEEEKAQLRAAAAQLERAASQLERVVPERRREPEYEGYD
jgi:septal ring factor EnvC (AmiA/AmiB activator)